jgi:protein TonB
MKRPDWGGSLGGALLIHGVLLALVGWGVRQQAVQTRPNLIPVKLAVSMGKTGTETPAGGSPARMPARDTAEQAVPEKEGSSLMEAMLQEAPRSNHVPVSESAGLSFSGSLAKQGGEGNGSEGLGGGNGTGEGRGSGEGSSGQEGNGTVDHSRRAVLSSYRKIYPASSRSAGEEGIVIVGVTISPSGSVTEAWIISGSGYGRLDQAALDSAYQWRFEPALDAHGNPVEGSAKVRVNYIIEK